MARSHTRLLLGALAGLGLLGVFLALSSLSDATREGCLSAEYAAVTPVEPRRPPPRWATWRDAFGRTLRETPHAATLRLVRLVDHEAPAAPVILSPYAKQVFTFPWRPSEAVSPWGGRLMFSEPGFVFAGTAEARSTLELSANGMPISSVPVDDTGRWEISSFPGWTRPFLLVGEAQVRARDLAGNVSPATTVLFSVWQAGPPP